MGQRFNYDRAAIVLCDAAIMGTSKAAAKWGVSDRAVQMWRAKLETDEKLRNLAHELRTKQIGKWLEDLPVKLSTLTQFMKASAQAMDTHDAENLEAVVKAFEAIADVYLTQTVINKRLENSSG